MIRQSLSRLRLGSLAAASSQAVAAAAQGSLGAAWAPQSAAALQLLDRWQHAGPGGGDGRAQHQHTSVRHLSFWPGGGASSRDEQAAQAPPDSVAAAAEDLGSLEGASSIAASAADTAAAAGSSTGMSDLLSAAAVVAAASGAEVDALAAAREEAWLGSRLVQALLCAVHGATGLPWWEDIMLCTLGMRLATLPVMISQVKNTYRLSQVGAGPPTGWLCGMRMNHNFLGARQAPAGWPATEHARTAAPAAQLSPPSACSLPHQPSRRRPGPRWRPSWST